jgi:hypothetical protein
VTSLLDPLLVVPQLPCFGLVPSPVGCEDRFHSEFGKPLNDVARTPDCLNAIFQFVEIVRLEKPIELEVTIGIIFRAHERVKEFRSGFAGFLHRGRGIARYEDECVVAAHRNTVLPCLPALWGRFGSQPHRDVDWLHRLPYHPDQVVAQGI